MDPREHAGAGDTGHDGDVGGVERGRLYESARVEAFSDNVMAVAITLLVLDLSFRSSPGQVLADLLRQWPGVPGVPGIVRSRQGCHRGLLDSI